MIFLDKMQFSAILRLMTYDWFCADRSHISETRKRFYVDAIHFEAC